MARELSANSIEPCIPITVAASECESAVCSTQALRPSRPHDGSSLSPEDDWFEYPVRAFQFDSQVEVVMDRPKDLHRNPSRCVMRYGAHV